MGYSRVGMGSVAIMGCGGGRRGGLVGGRGVVEGGEGVGGVGCRP